MQFAKAARKSAKNAHARASTASVQESVQVSLQLAKAVAKKALQGQTKIVPQKGKRLNCNRKCCCDLFVTRHEAT